MRNRLLLALAALALTAVPAVALAHPAHRAAVRTKPFMLGVMDDALLNYQPATAFSAIQALHPQVIRYDADWPQVAPTTRPAQPRNPADPAYDFTAVDNVVKNAAALNVPVMLTIVHTPVWAGGGLKHNHAPANVADLQDYAYAIATRYSGTYTPPGATAPLPAVHLWEAWNEPNTQTHLAPQFSCHDCGRRAKPVSPRIYAKLLTAIYSGVHQAGQAVGVSETVAGGATRPSGDGPDSFEPSVPPLTFLRLLGRQRPPLDVYSHHPYRRPGYVRKPGRVDPNIFFGDLPRLLKALDRAFPGRHLHLWITEYGMQTNPPDQGVGVPLATQAQTLQTNVTKSIANPRIDMLIWFLIDDEPIQGAHWSGFQSGLAFVNGSHKPSWDTFTALAVPH